MRAPIGRGRLKSLTMYFAFATSACISPSLWRVVIAGPPNVGKSSLINAMAGYERAIVSPLPGTTRDVVTLTTAIDGWPVQLADTAGLRASDDELESAGVKLAGAALAAADLVILVCDATGDLNAASEIASQISAATRTYSRLEQDRSRNNECPRCIRS